MAVGSKDIVGGVGALSLRPFVIRDSKLNSHKSIESIEPWNPVSTLDQIHSINILKSLRSGIYQIFAPLP